MSFGEPSELEAAYEDYPDVHVRNNPNRGDAQLRVQLTPSDGDETAGFPLAPANEAGYRPQGVAANYTDIGDGTFVATVVLFEQPGSGGDA